jgi:uroporphyrinogen-III decarboxylase
MTERDRILAAIRGEIPDRLPWVPRLEFWHRAARRAQNVPAEWEGLGATEIADHLGAGRYAVIPDFTDCPDGTGMIDRGLGIFRIPTLTYDVELDGVERRVSKVGAETLVEYHTPAGVVRTGFLFTSEMLDAGASMPWSTGHPVRGPQDFEAVGYIFEHLKVIPRLDGYRRLRDQIGERGIAVAWVMGTACPMQHIMKELMPTEQFFYAMADYPEKVLRLAERLEPFFDAIQRTALDSPAEVVLLGGNYDDSITSPPFFHRYILPALRKYAGLLHSRGKYLITHTDGENRRLLPLYREADFDIADSVCPYPMTRCSLDQLYAALADRIAIWGGIPSILLCPGSASFRQFRDFVDALIERYAHRSRLILGVSDMVTADAELDRLRYIGEKVQAMPVA